MALQVSIITWPSLVDLATKYLKRGKEKSKWEERRGARRIETNNDSSEPWRQFGSESGSESGVGWQLNDRAASRRSTLGRISVASLKNAELDEEQQHDLQHAVVVTIQDRSEVVDERKLSENKVKITDEEAGENKSKSLQGLLISTQFNNMPLQPKTDIDGPGAGDMSKALGIEDDTEASSNALSPSSPLERLRHRRDERKVKKMASSTSISVYSPTDLATPTSNTTNTSNSTFSEGGETSPLDDRSLLTSSFSTTLAQDVKKEVGMQFDESVEVGNGVPSEDEVQGFVDLSDDEDDESEKPTTPNKNNKSKNVSVIPASASRISHVAKIPIVGISSISSKFEFHTAANGDEDEVGEDGEEFVSNTNEKYESKPIDKVATKEAKGDIGSKWQNAKVKSRYNKKSQETLIETNGYRIEEKEEPRGQELSISEYENEMKLKSHIITSSTSTAKAPPPVSDSTNVLLSVSASVIVSSPSCVVREELQDNNMMKVTTQPTIPPPKPSRSGSFSSLSSTAIASVSTTPLDTTTIIAPIRDTVVSSAVSSTSVSTRITVSNSSVIDGEGKEHKEAGVGVSGTLPAKPRRPSMAQTIAAVFSFSSRQLPNSNAVSTSNAVNSTSSSAINLNSTVNEFDSTAAATVVSLNSKENRTSRLNTSPPSTITSKAADIVSTLSTDTSVLKRQSLNSGALPLGNGDASLFAQSALVSSLPPLSPPQPSPTPLIDLSVLNLPPLSEFAEAAGIVYEGWLEKKSHSAGSGSNSGAGGGVMGAISMSLQLWRLRYFVLAESPSHFCELRIYKRAIDCGWGMAPVKLRAAIPVLSIESIDAISEKSALGRDFSVTILVDSLRTLVKGVVRSKDALGDDDGSDASSIASDDRSLFIY